MTTKSEVANYICDSLGKERGLYLKDIKDIIKEYHKFIVKEVKEGRAVTINGVGAIKPKERSARKQYNMQTGETVMVEKKNYVQFKPYKSFVGTLNDEE